MGPPGSAQLAGFYFFHFGLLGLLMPYLPLYLQERGLAGGLIGVLMGLLMGTKLLSPPLIGMWIDRRGELLRPLRVTLFATVLAWLLFMSARGQWALGIAMALFTLTWNATLPAFETLTLHRLGPDRIGQYGRIRLWGSVGFIAAGIGGALRLDTPGHLLRHFPIAGLILASGMLLLGASQSGREPVAAAEPAQRGWLALLGRPGVPGFLLTLFLLHLSHGPYYALFTLYLEGLGFSPARIGLLWILGVVAEVGLFWVTPTLFARFGRRSLLIAALILTAVRWALIGTLAAHPVFLMMAQVLHLASFGLCHAVGMSYVHALFPGALQGRGQALYSALGFGAGGVAGSLMGGLLWAAGWRGEIYLLAMLAALIAALIAWRAIPFWLPTHASPAPNGPDSN
ncbi:MFS transporter [Candidatus Macondimonas diazotrophica]|jgi:PPP family 3-phenylpropionic acid transporter|uniref:MFS transporter n=1 Tax=Candidatus Macondimonas diazotrophica TaxID=2305248 RepID=A0A4Z0F9P1_9GAMM|nr:MFS transporter [Candidatus Macondimonas diazotrophica]NCU01102.1 MFS transporter [Candidatus Macondimonas diazotrophica]TFZ82829.1 MFS transporter [Candidatus Macondimonas diazotrophica]HBG31158.1 MFS transporter [Gammaproteobacteria bacterium]HBG52444.1 MFS transporter [Gammaproteobacteria bacterium]